MPYSYGDGTDNGVRPRKLASLLNPDAMRQIPLYKNGIILEILSEEDAVLRMSRQKNLVGVYNKRKSHRLKAIKMRGCDMLRPMSQGSRGKSFQQELSNGYICWALTGTPGSI